MNKIKLMVCPKCGKETNTAVDQYKDITIQYTVICNHCQGALIKPIDILL